MEAGKVCIELSMGSSAKGFPGACWISPWPLIEPGPDPCDRFLEGGEVVCGEMRVQNPMA